MTVSARATVLGVIFGLFKVSDFKVLKLVADVYIDIIRGTLPGAGHDYDVRWEVLKPYGFQWSNIGGAFTAGCVALSPMQALIWRKSAEELSVDKGQMEAARSLGLLRQGHAQGNFCPRHSGPCCLHYQPVYHLPEGHIPCVRHRPRS